MNNSFAAKKKIEFGDFQTPVELARLVCELIAKKGFKPQTVIEPNCGEGNFLNAARRQFHSATQILGFDISERYVTESKAKFESDSKVKIAQADFFDLDWSETLSSLSKPILVLGNPPWVTNSSLGVLKSSNLPTKTNFQNLKGLDALTGKSNFDVSEWMLIKLLHALQNQKAVLAMLCKTQVARKILAYAWKHEIEISDAVIYQIDSTKYFNASVDACLFYCDFCDENFQMSAKVFKNITDGEPNGEIGLYQGELIASLELHEKWRHLRGNSNIKWRSGIKHDCSKVMELKKIGDKYENGFGELIELENDYVYPLLKSSDVANGATNPRRFVIVTQQKVGQETCSIEQNAPQTWNYLMKHADLLDNRGSSIYQNKPRFAMFGIGDYSFAKWKVAISGFYKKLFFAAVHEHENKPMMLDDTCYFIPCESKVEAESLAFRLNSSVAKEFFESIVFWDAKRPITTQLLQKLDLAKLSQKTDTQNSTNEVENLRDGKRETFDAENLRKQWRKEKRAARKSANSMGT